MVASVLLSAGLVAVAHATATAARAAGDIAVAVSPTSAIVGQPVEVLVRTFLPIDQRDLTLPVESPLEPYPVPSGVWNVLYPWPDYPFDVVARHPDGTEIQLPLVRDPADATVWRGTVSLPKAGAWTIWVRNFQHKELGSTAAVTVVSGSPTTVAGSIEGASAVFIAALFGLLGGFVVGGVWRRRRPS
jgi:hypothetical protein